MLVSAKMSANEKMAACRCRLSICGPKLRKRSVLQCRSKAALSGQV
ncbi:hypothetical protein JOS77_05635 [Chromobacterium haemolyticum]|nr:hypothetical protein JOS77_05635 [Chromobacterium haemolyticum]